MSVFMWMIIIFYIVPALINILYFYFYYIPKNFKRYLKDVYIFGDLFNLIIEMIGDYMISLIPSLIPLANLIVLFDPQMGIFWKIIKSIKNIPIKKV